MELIAEKVAVPVDEEPQPTKAELSKKAYLLDLERAASRYEACLEQSMQLWSSHLTEAEMKKNMMMIKDTATTLFIVLNKKRKL